MTFGKSSQSSINPQDAEVTVFSSSGHDSSGSRLRPLHIAIGMFDGVHLGHQAVIRQAIEAASRETGHCSAVLTFDPHPSRVLYPKQATPLLMPLESRIAQILSLGTDYVIVQKFTLQYSQQDAVDFVPSMMEKFHGLKSIHVGENFRFGHGRIGNVDTLRDTATRCGIELRALDRKVYDGMAISSSRIRAELIEGSIRTVNSMLGYPYMVSGRIIAGKGIGRTLGFPTLNIHWNPEVSPRFGVYLVRLARENLDEDQFGIANYGLRPTVDSSEEPLLEVHLLDSQKAPAPGDLVDVRLLDFIRPERQFESIDALKLQIGRDIQLVKTMLEQGGVGL